MSLNLLAMHVEKTMLQVYIMLLIITITKIT